MMEEETVEGGGYGKGGRAINMKAAQKGNEKMGYGNKRKGGRSQWEVCKSLFFEVKE